MNAPDPEVRVLRAALAEVESREVNETVDPAPEAGWDLGLVPRRCECGDPNCLATIRMTVAEYEAVRENSRRFAIVEGHVFPEAEVVVSQQARYAIVEKREAAAAIAEAHDPRA